ncbi:unnamed protein product [Kuraishia capsulata CBS 1993]|uniref:Uncharacterized protein n=1 Tax=Kuraishia capsulata CBS 1993 TaxID=1382522 RepID=W6MPW1_9ASCO|nr:uncharacterized protein KUCA_T00004355001 [Kuraishia capsulata CBS 1993]CDK28373.1 unnamed protein product [Kuraishia capsulata CBS 1993]
MGLFKRSQPEKTGFHGGVVSNEKITSEDERRYKFKSGNVHDPILSAVNEAQPFEQQANDHHRQVSLSNASGDGYLRDIFGYAIQVPDVSNPARSRDERPMDTIRSFEYAITGDATYRNQLETPQLGFRVRNDFPTFGVNPYASEAPPANAYYAGDSFAQSQPVYQAPLKEAKDAKKKRWFGKKK